MSEKGKSQQAYQGSRVVTAVGIGAMTLIVGVYGARLLMLQSYQDSKAPSRSSAVSSSAIGDGQTTVIVSRPNSSDCRRDHLNIGTGTRSESGPSDCADAGSQPSRVKTISKSFRNR